MLQELVKGYVVERYNWEWVKNMLYSNVCAGENGHDVVNNNNGNVGSNGNVVNHNNDDGHGY